MEIIFPRDFDVVGLRNFLESRVLNKKIFGVHYLFNYKEKNVKQAIWEMKFKSNKKVAEVFGKFLSFRIIELCKTGDEYLILPTPVHKKRRNERGFNQCEWLCKEIIKNIEKNIETSMRYCPNILIREKYTTKQSWSNKESRENKLKGAFNVSGKFQDKITGAKIILVDDVLTTGSTIKEMHRTLIKFGALEIISIVISH